MLVDTHAHLDLPEFEQDLPRVIQRAMEAGVTTILAVGIEPASCTRTLEIAEAYPHIFAIVGFVGYRETLIVLWLSVLPSEGFCY